MYDALDEYAVNQIDDATLNALLSGHVYTSQLKHNDLTALKNMELIRVGFKGHVTLTNSGAIYASMMVSPPI